MKEKMIDCLLEKLTAKPDCPGDVTEDELLISSIGDFIDEKGLESGFRDSGIGIDMLPDWFEMYYAPVRLLSFDEARNWFVNRRLHKMVEQSILSFVSYSGGPNRSKEATAKLRRDIMNYLSPLAEDPDYDLYIEEVRMRLDRIAAKANESE